MSLPATAAELARLIDHTLLDPCATTEAIRFLCRDARERGMFSVCVHPCRVAAAKQNLRGSPVAVCTVIGFPLGANTRASKGAEARDAIGAGADELDMVMNLGLLFDVHHVGAGLKVVTDWLGDPARVLSYFVRFTRPVVVPDTDEGTEVVYTGTITQLADGVATVAITATCGDDAVLGAAKAEVRVD